MGMPAKKKAPAIDERKPRIKAFAAFVCAQPFDIPAREVTRVARTVGYDVVSVSAVVAYRSRYEHLRFVAGDPPTAFVKEFLASAASQKAKQYTATNSNIGLKGVTSPPTVSPVRLTNGAISAIVDSVLSEPTNAALKKAVPAEAWGYRADGTPRKKTGPKSTTPLHEKLKAQARQTFLGEVPEVSAQPSPLVPAIVEPVAPEPAPAVEPVVALAVEPTTPAPAVPEPVVEPAATPKAEPEPVVEPVAAPTAIEAVVVAPAPQEEEDDDVLLQQLRDSFEIGDIVHVMQPTLRGAAVTREGRIEAKESKFATVALGSTINKIPYKRISLAPQMSGRNRTKHANSNDKHVTHANSNGDVTHANSNGDPAEQILKAVPPSFAKLKTVLPASPTPREPDPKPKLEAAAPAPAVIPTPPPAPAVITPAPPPAPAAVIAKPSPALSEPTSHQKDLRAWIEMGTAFGDLLPATEAALRAEADELTQEINRLTVARDGKLKQADTLSSYIRITQVGSEK